MQNARFTWFYPTTRQAGGEVVPGDIASAEVAIRVVGAPDWTVLGKADYPASEFTQNDLAEGDYEARVVAIEPNGQQGLYGFASFTVLDASPLGAPTDIAVELT